MKKKKEVMELKAITRDGIKINKLKCPVCGQWADLDNDQFHGRVSTWCNCNKFHETIDFSKEEITSFYIEGNFSNSAQNTQKEED